MQKFLRYDTQIFPQERIETFGISNLANGENGMVIKLFGFPDAYQLTDHLASRAYDDLNGYIPAMQPPASVPDISVLIAGQPTPVSQVTLIDGTAYGFVVLGGISINVDNIEWADLAAKNAAGQPVIQVRVASDATGTIRELAGKDAEAAYDILVSLVGNDEQAAATN